MYKKVIWSLVGLIGVLIGIFIVVVLTNPKEAPKKVDTPIKQTETQTSDSSDVKVEENGTGGSENPFGKKTPADELTEQDVQNYIHKMSHQKVIADEKWGFYEITPERIDWLLEVIDHKDFKNTSVYEDILQRWKEGDFSKVDKDHNAIWRLQGGTIGKATGILSPEKEEAFIKKTKEQ